jgi:hypothetical protein
MRKRASAARYLFRVWLSLNCLLGIHNLFAAPTNSFTSPTTAAWESLSWSLGVRPDISQGAIMVTNYGQKGIILGANARDNFPGTMLISNLTLAGTPLSTNTLLLNFTGTTSPLRVRNSCTVQSNSVLLNLSSALDIAGANSICLIDGGTMNQSGGSNIFEGSLYVGTTNFGQYNLTNGAILADNISIGGNNATPQSGSGLFNMINGSIQAREIDVGAWESDGEFIQHAGSISATANLMIGQNFAADGRYTLQTGSLQASNTFIGNYPYSTGEFIQTGGAHVTGDLRIGLYLSHTGVGDGGYTLNGGLLQCQNIGLDEGDGFFTPFSQSGGTNLCSGDLVLEGIYALSGGELHDNDVTIYNPGAFFQTGGKHIVTNTLSIFLFYNPRGGNGSPSILHSGSLQCGQLELTGGASDGVTAFQHDGGSLNVFGQISLNDGAILASNVTEQFGPLLLYGSTSRDSLSGSTQHFADSSNIQWDPNGSLLVFCDNSSKVYFGNSASALTPHQLLQIAFNFGYARLLDNGQLVSWPVPPIDYQMTTTNLSLNWIPPWGTAGTPTLQAADHVEGPYTDVSTATCPYVVAFNNHAKFFRLHL